MTKIRMPRTQQLYAVIQKPDGGTRSSRDWTGSAVESGVIDIIEQLQKRGVGFCSINDGVIDTTTASDEMIFNIFGTLAQFERRLIQERIQAGLTAARARGRKGGRPKYPRNIQNCRWQKHEYQ